MLGIVEGENGIAKRGCKVGTSLPSLDDDLRYLLQCLDGMFAFADMHEAHGGSNDADRLHLSLHTVIAHRKNISRKLNIHSTAGLTIYAIVNHLIDIESVEFTNL